LSNLTASVELRKTNQKKSQDILRNSFIPNTVRPLGVFPSSTFDYNNYHAALSYKITPDIMVYVSTGNGTKAGGFNQRATFISELTFQPEKSKSTEIGAKTSWFDNRVQLNAAAYDTKTRDIQFTGASDDPTNVGLVTKNFGGTNNKGYELELVAKPSKGLRLNVGYAYTDPKFIAGTYDFSNAALCLALPTCGAGRVVTGLRSASGVVRSAVDLNGITPPRVSKRMVSSGVEFSEKLGMYNWFTRIDYRYESKQNVGETNLATTQLPDRSVVNVRSSVSWGAFTVTGYINNLTNSTVPAIVTYNVRLNDFVGNLVSYLPPERTFGLTLGYKF
jgi:outer membrane receptor protein involved in Fe transport